VQRGPFLRFPVIAGPTAGGKSDLAVAVALALRDRHNLAAEIVTADSMQVYRGLDIGSAKPTPEERRGIPHHLIDVADPADPAPFTVDRWLTLAEAAIADIRSRGGTPIVVGGTHLYIKALLEGLFEGPPADPALRAELAAMDPAQRRALLEQVDPAAAARIHPNDARRTIRALEVHRLTGRPISELQRQWDTGRVRPDCFLVGLEWPPDLLARRINARVRAMMDRGLLEETRALWESGRLMPGRGGASEALGYKQLLAYFQGPQTPARLEEAVEEIKIETRRFAKNQRTWLRRLRATPGSIWIRAEATPLDQQAQLVIQHMFAPPPPPPTPAP